MQAHTHLIKTDMMQRGSPGISTIFFLIDCPVLLKYTRLVSWYFEPSQPLGIISGLTLQYILRTTDKDLSPHMLFQQGRQLIHLTPPSIIKHMLMKTRYDYLYLVLGA